MNTLEVGDIVTTNKIMHFVEAFHSETEDHIEVFLPKWHTLTVVAVNAVEDTVDVQLPDGYVATLSIEDLR